MCRALIVALVALLVIGVLPASAAPGAPGRDLVPGPAPQHDEQLSGADFVRPLAQSRKNPALASALVAVEQQARNQGPAAGVRQAEATGVGMRGEQVRVTIQADGGNVDAARAAVTQVGGTVEASAGGLVDASVPTGGLAQLASAPGVGYVAPTRRLIPTAVKGQEVEASGANTWQNGGAAGAGVKIAVMDGDFLGYKDRQAAGDLPKGLITADFCGSDGFENNLDGGHGTAVAEIVYETAPGAQLYLVCAGTLTQMVQAVDYMVAQGIKIVNHSRGIFNTSRADGAYSSSDPSFLPESLITKAYNGGIVWVNSAGNSGATHWAGAFSDTDSDSVHNFTDSDEGNNITVRSNGTVSIFLKWDNWPTTSEDFDLYLSRASDGQVVAFSVNDQSGSATPTEDLSYTNRTSADQNLFISIVRYRSTSNPAMDLFIEGNTSTPQYTNPAGSLTDFAVSPRALVVGAACWQTKTTIEGYSSRGPTIDGRVKPDITGYDSVSNATFGDYSTCGTSGFSGTSAAAPNVAAAGALLKDANPSWTRDQIIQGLKDKTVDAGPSGTDSTYGVGVLTLGAAPPLPGTPSCTTSGRANTVTVSTAKDASTKTLTTTLTASGTSNNLLRVVFGSGSRSVTNASLSFADGRGIGSTETIYTPFGSTSSMSFRTQRTTSGSPVTVPFVVTDRCGTWESFVGGGTGATGF